MGFFLPQPSRIAGRVTLLVQIHPHELFDGQLTGGCVLKLYQSDTGQGAGYQRILRLNYQRKINKLR